LLKDRQQAALSLLSNLGTDGGEVGSVSWGGCGRCTVQVGNTEHVGGTADRAVVTGADGRLTFDQGGDGRRHGTGCAGKDDGSDGETHGDFGEDERSFLR